MGARLFGRDAPLEDLRTALADALGGRGQIALVSGEAGIGKSALAAAITAEAEARGALVTRGRAWEFADAPPYFPVWPCLRALGITPSGGEHGHDGGEAFQLWENVASSLARTSARTPAVWVLEDLHAADLGTLDLLTFIAQPLRAMHVLVVATMRSSDPRLSDRGMQRLTRMARDGLDVRLGPLSARDVVALTEETFGYAVPKGAVDRLVELTGGNPLFVVECARAFRAAGGIEGTLSSLPPTIRQVVLDRVASLPEATRDALACGAVLGREFSAASVARMAESLPARVIDTLLPALRTGLLAETKPGQFIFGHTLVRDAIDDALGAERRAELHVRADAALAALGDTADILMERTRHALAALRSGDEQLHALALADRAAELLEHEGAFDRAFELHARVLEARAAGFLPPAAPSRKLHIASIARAAGRSSVSRGLCEEVVAAARAGQDAALLAHAALLHAANVRPGVVDRSQVALLEEARDLLGERSPELVCRVLARLATALQPAVDQTLPMGMTRDAIRRAHATNDDAAIIDVLDLAGWGFYRAPMEDRIAVANELLERAIRTNDLPRALNAYEWLAFYAMATGDFGASDRHAASMLALSDEIGHPRYRWRALLLASGHATTRGHFAESDRYVTEVAELAALTDDPALGLAFAVHGILRLMTQRRDERLGAALAEAARVVDGMSDVVNGPARVALNEAMVAARMEDVETTRAAIARIGTRAAVLYVDPTTAAVMAEPYALAGSDEDRRRIREAMKPLGARFGGDQVSFIYGGHVARLRGLLDLALGDLESGEAGLREAHADAIAHGHGPWVAQIAHELAKLLRRTGREDEARVFALESSRIARELGMTGLVGVVPEAKACAVSIEREGDVWKVAAGATVVRVKDSRGMQLLARLVERPAEEVHVLALASDEATSVPESSAGEVLDERARRAYRQRLADLADDIVEAKSLGDPKRIAKLQSEDEALRGELLRATGLGGRARQAGSATERARVNVQRRVKDAIARIAELDDGLGRFFGRTVSTGTFCCFKP